jgi:putative DNA primase/helicase
VEQFSGPHYGRQRGAAGFLQRYIGYCLTGLTAEHAFVFGYGTGANGKGTFINTISGVLGDYATTAAMSTFLASTTEQHPTDLAKLHGARLVVAQETQKGRRWDEIKIKALTGGDNITARFMRQDFFDYTPTFKLFICGNHKPRLSSVDEAMRRRLLLVPFTVHIPPSERDLRLTEKLKPEWPSILRWCITGALKWQAEGLSPPAAVREATDEYLRDQDAVRQWLEDCTSSDDPAAVTRTARLFASWRSWCDERNVKPGSEQTLVQTLIDKGYPKWRDKQGRGFSGIALRGG